MNTALVQLHSTDKLKLPGLYYTPVSPTNRVAIWLHGMGDSGIFYNPERMNALGKALCKQGIAFLAFNNRGAHNKKKLHLNDDTIPEEDRIYSGGTHYEKIADCIYDIDGAVVFLRKLGYTDFSLIGHSTGANKICSYVQNKTDNPFSRYVLAGPGDDSGLFFNELGEKRFFKALSYAQKAVAANRPLALLPRYTGMHPFSAQAAVDILNPDGDYNTFPFFESTTKRLGTKPLFKELRKIDGPVLTIIGENDAYMYTAGGVDGAFKLIRQHLPQKLQNKSSFIMVPGADHSFTDHETEFAEHVAQWLVDARS